MNKQDSLSLWKQRIEEQKNSGMGIREWCESKQLSRDAYYYWRKKIQGISSPCSDRISFVKLPISKEEQNPGTRGGLTLQWKEFTLSVTDSFSLPLLTELGNCETSIQSQFQQGKNQV